MLPKKERLNLRTDFSRVAKGHKLEGSLFKIFFCFGENKLPLIGIAAGKTVFKKAVERNRARRLISFAFEDIYEKLPKNVNIIALPKKEVLTKNSAEVSVLLKELLEKEKLL